MQKWLLEVCCGSAESAIAAFRGGADRVELNSDLFHGGLTPSIGTLQLVKQMFPDKPVMCMVRPRECGFHYSPLETEVMLLDAKALLAAGADGIVFGFLKEDGSIDEEKCAAMLQVIGHKTSVFHRAFDVCPDWRIAMDQLIRLGVTRILTSGQRATAPAGANTLREMICCADGRIEILPGCGIRLNNVRELQRISGATQFHSGISSVFRDNSCLINPFIHFMGTMMPEEDCYTQTIEEDVAAFVSMLKP